MPRCVHDMEEKTCAICLGLCDPPKRKSTCVERAELLFTYAVDHSRWTKEEACAALGFSPGILTQTIRELRKILGGDTINVIVVFEDKQHYYKLVGDLISAMPWAAVRMHSVEAQLETISAVIASICKATNPHSRDGKKARLVAAQLNILQMQLASID